MFNPNSSQDGLLLIVAALQDLEKLRGYQWSKTISRMELDCCFSAQRQPCRGRFVAAVMIAVFLIIHREKCHRVHNGNPLLCWEGFGEFLQVFLGYYFSRFQQSKKVIKTFQVGREWRSGAWLSCSREHIWCALRTDSRLTTNVSLGSQAFSLTHPPPQYPGCRCHTAQGKVFPAHWQAEIMSSNCRQGNYWMGRWPLWMQNTRATAGMAGSFNCMARAETSVSLLLPASAHPLSLQPPQAPSPASSISRGRTWNAILEAGNLRQLLLQEGSASGGSLFPPFPPPK